MERRKTRAIYQPEAVEAETIVPVPDTASWWQRFVCDRLGHKFTAWERNVYYNALDDTQDCQRRCGALNPAYTRVREQRRPTPG